MLAPWRTGMPERPAVAFDRFAAQRQMRKRWRWVGAFAEDVMLCAAVARIGPAPVLWWALWDRETRTLAEATIRGPAFGHLLRHPSRKRGRAVHVGDETIVVDDGPVRMDLRVARGAAVETISPHGAAHIWTRKTPVSVSGTAAVGDRHFTLDAAPGLADDSDGYHARRTDWRWSAGVGTTHDGTPVTWNFVTGLHDAAAASERTVWIGGTPHHVPDQAFAHDLSRVGELAFTAEATRAHKENLLLVASDYEQPFGRFAGTLPVAGPITGLGVMERHSARW